MMNNKFKKIVYKKSRSILNSRIIRNKFIDLELSINKKNRSQILVLVIINCNLHNLVLIKNKILKQKLKLLVHKVQ